MKVNNARPRIVSHGFDTFVPFHRVESLHQRLTEMTNNDINSWSFFRPAASPDGGWDEDLDDYNENFALQDLYPGYYQNTAAQPQANNLQKATHCPSGNHGQYNNYNSSSTSYSMPQGQATGLNCEEKRGPMLANGYSQGFHGQRHGSFAEFSNTRHGLKQYTYQNLGESDLVPVASVSQTSYRDDVPMIGDFSIGAASPSTTYSGYSTSSTTVDPISLIQVTAPHPQNASTKGVWWQETARNGQSHYQNTYGSAIVHDGLQRMHNQQYSDMWAADSGSSDIWQTQAAQTGIVTSTAPITISPKALTLSFPAPSLSSSESGQSLILPLSDASSASISVASSRQDTPESIPETLQVVEPQVATRQHRQHRQILPDSLPQPRAATILQSNDSAFRKSTRKKSLRTASDTHLRRKASPPSCSGLRIGASPAIAPRTDPTVPQVSLSSKKGEPKRMSDVSSSTAQAEHHRNAKDDFLVKSKLAGMSYKDIRRQGNFPEAESTLRGRFRTLTKSKAARVRKPEWTENDVRLLKKAVRKLTSGSDISKGKVPWKMVAEYIANNGGSYHFGNATCRKRWDDLPVKRS